MTPIARVVTPEPIRSLREAYVREMDCQVIHDSIHDRAGWTIEYALRLGDVTVGYGSVALAGPGKDKPTLYEFYVAPGHRDRTFDLFDALLAAARPVAIETQSNAPLLTAMLHLHARDVASESILFHDRLTTHLTPPPGVAFRRSTPDDVPRMPEGEENAEFLLEADGAVAAAGGILYHYNRPYGDIYMSVAEPFRRRGLGAYLVQELKCACRESGSVPAARCNLTNVASRRTLQKAGFVPCGHILTGTPASARVDLAAHPGGTPG
jgi:GNAT superfamily N-acetyltransferase